MAKKAAKAPKKRSSGGRKALIMKRIEWMPISNSHNSMFTDRMVMSLEKRIRKDPALWVFYGPNGKVTWAEPAENGTAKLRAWVKMNKKKHWFEKFGVYTISKRAYMSDIDALASRLISSGSMPMKPKNFMRAKNTGEEVKRDMNQWANTEMKKINRSLKPMERKYKKSLWRLDKKEEKLRKRYMKRIEKAKDGMRQKKLRTERDKKVMQLKMQRKKLDPWRKNIVMWNSKLKSFQNVKF
ncbi:MAG: hypothetical protein ACHQX1_01610 [Candidatus Micrarchaeales archaeon]